MLLADIAGLAAALVLLLATLPLRGDFATAMLTPAFWLKEAFVTLLAGAALVLALRLAQPGARPGPALAAAVLCVAALWLVALVTLAVAPPLARPGLIFGTTSRVCPWLIALLSGPLLVAGLWAMRGLAPTRLVAAGFAAGLAAGALAALVYSLHCTEDAPPFIALWYLAGMLIPAGLGALLGPRLLRW